MKLYRLSGRLSFLRMRPLRKMIGILILIDPQSVKIWQRIEGKRQKSFDIANREIDHNWQIPPFQTF